MHKSLQSFSKTHRFYTQVDNGLEHSRKIIRTMGNLMSLDFLKRIVAMVPSNLRNVRNIMTKTSLCLPNKAGQLLIKGNKT